MPKAKANDAMKPTTKPARPEPRSEIPNATTREAIRDAEEGRVTRYASVDDLFKELGGK